jgi:tRNA pseudouridine38-40 synthase
LILRYFIHLAYKGTNYSGWQRQENTADTIQQIIEGKLSLIYKKKVTAYGCGRTDAGVHASQYVLHIDLDEAPSLDLKFLLNKNLPEDIAVYAVLEVADDQHSRYDASSRTYDYFVHWKKDPFLIGYSALYDDLSLDFDLMREAVALLSSTKDFRPLCKQPDLYNNTLCKITNCALFVDEQQGRLRFTITSNRFLRGMVRLCVSFLLQVGTRKISLKKFSQLLRQEIELNHKRPALPNGLFLSRITYPFLELEESSKLIKMMKLGLE